MLDFLGISRRTVVGAAAALALFSLAAPSQADLNFFTDPGQYQAFLSSFGRQDETVDFNDPGLITSGPTVTGDAAGDIVRFQEVPGGGENLTTPSGGQARVEAADAGLNSIFISPDNPQDVFTALQLNPNLPAGESGFATVQVFNEDGTFDFDLGSGQNFFGIVATNGQSFEGVQLKFFTDDTMQTPLDIDDVRQVRVEFGVNAVPEPAFYQLSTLLGLGGLGLLRWRRGRKTRID